MIEIANKNHFHWVISFVTEHQKGGRKEFFSSANTVSWQDINEWERKLEEEFNVICKIVAFSLVECDCLDEVKRIGFDKDW